MMKRIFNSISAKYGPYLRCDMRLRNAVTLVAVLGIVALFTSAGAWAAKPDSYAFSDIREQVQFFDCSYFGMDFEILADWTYNESGRLHYDKDANLVRINGFFFNTDRRAYNSNDPSKAIEDGVNMVGAAEHQHFVVKFAEGIDVYYKESGISFKAVIPGYGSLVLNAGTVAYERVDGEWVPINFTPNRLTLIEDWYAMCVFLQ